MGGYDKKIPFEPMAETVCDKVKTVILMGVTAPKIEAAIRGAEIFLGHLEYFCPWLNSKSGEHQNEAFLHSPSQTLWAVAHRLREHILSQGYCLC